MLLLFGNVVWQSYWCVLLRQPRTPHPLRSSRTQLFSFDRAKARKIHPTTAPKPSPKQAESKPSPSLHMELIVFNSFRFENYAGRKPWEDMPVSRLYALFAKACGITLACLNAVSLHSLGLRSLHGVGPSSQAQALCFCL